jgi:hypothetical protein
MSRRLYQISGLSKSQIDVPANTKYVVVDQAQQTPKPKTRYVIADNNQPYYKDDNVVYVTKKKPQVTTKPSYVYIDDDDDYEYEEYDDTYDYKNKKYAPVIISPRSKPKVEKYYIKPDRYPNEYIYDDEEPYYTYEHTPRSRYYRPVRKVHSQLIPTPRTQSYEWNKQSPRKTLVPMEPLARNRPREVIYNNNIKKRNHRFEIDEPVIRDKPTPNKNVIYGGSVVYK